VVECSGSMRYEVVIFGCSIKWNYVVVKYLVVVSMLWTYVMVICSANM